MKTTIILPLLWVSLCISNTTLSQKVAATKTESVKATPASNIKGINPAPSTNIKEIEPILEKLLSEFNVAGFSVAVVHKDSLIYTKGFGYRDLENKKPVTPNTLFSIGSVTKAFTAALLGNLKSDNKLNLDDNASKYLPNLHFSDKRESQVTIKDMMTHRSGLPRYDHSWYLFNTDSRADLLSRIQYMKPSAELRSKWQYNNFMYLALGMITEKITGKSWEENIQEKFFLPLNMQRSNFDVNVMQKDADAAVGYAADQHKKIIKLPYFEIKGMGPAGSINSSVVEMSSWVKVWLNGGKYGKQAILPTSYIREAMAAQMVMNNALPNQKHSDIHLSNYGLGWMIGSYRGHYQVEHGGNIDGFSSSISIFPTDSIGIIILTNQNGSPVPAIIRNYIADKVLGIKFYDWSESEERKKQIKPASTSLEQDAGKIPSTTPSRNLKEFTGSYHHPAYGSFEISLHRDTLFAKFSNQLSWLRHFHYDVFEIKAMHATMGPDTSIGGLKLNFRSSDAGKIESATATLDVLTGAEEFKKLIQPASSARDEFYKYTGIYEFGGMQITVSVKNRTLFIFVPGQKDYETVYLGETSFSLKDVHGYSTKFIIGEDAKVKSIIFIQPNGSFEAKKVK